MGPSLRSPRRWIPPLVVLACAIAPAGSSATPVAGKLVDVGPVENSKPASIKCPGETAFAKVAAPRQVAVGCEVDLGNGWISITTARADGTPQTGTFSGTRVHFRITQEGDTGVVTEIPPYFCRGPSGFFADTQGLFRMVGRYGSATGQTAQWHMDD